MDNTNNELIGGGILIGLSVLAVSVSAGAVAELLIAKKN